MRIRNILSFTQLIRLAMLKIPMISDPLISAFTYNIIFTWYVIKINSVTTRLNKVQISGR